MHLGPLCESISGISRNQLLMVECSELASVAVPVLSLPT